MAGHTKGPWVSVIDDTGGRWSGWPLCICPAGDDDRSVVRTGGQWPYEWDAHTSQAEALANARLIAAAPELLEALTALLSYDEQDAGCVPTDAHLDAQNAARAAIAKATHT